MSGNLLNRSQIISAEVKGMGFWGHWVCPHEQNPMSSLTYSLPYDAGDPYRSMVPKSLIETETVGRGQLDLRNNFELLFFSLCFLSSILLLPSVSFSKKVLLAQTNEASQ